MCLDHKKTLKKTRIKLYRVTHWNLTSFEYVVLSRWAEGGGRDEVVGILFLWVGHFQQDGATMHTANESMTIVRNMFPGHLIPVSETCRGPLVVTIFQCVIFSFGGIWNRVFTLANSARWMIWRKPSIRKFVWSIVSCWPVSWTLLKKAWKLHPRRLSSSQRYHF